MTSRISVVILTLVFVLMAGSYQAVNSQKGPSKAATFDGFKLVDSTGNIRKPADYRDNFQVLGSWTVLEDR